MRQDKKPLWICLTITLAALLILFLGAVAYWRMKNLLWASHRQTQAALHSLTKKLDAALQEQEAMRSRIEALETERGERLDDLSAMRADLATIREELQSRGEVPTSEPASLGVSLHEQTHSLSCEAASVAMVADFFGVSLTEEEVIEALPRNENPNLGFRGHIDGPTGGLEDYGVHAAPIKKLLTEHGLRAAEVEGGLDGVRRALKAGHPVIAWITYHLWEQTPVELELSSGAKMKMVPYEHTVVIEGYTEDGLWALDPYDGERQFLPWMDFERSWGYLDQMALAIREKSH
ncbi:MAG: C39 family peptidase [Chloroflexota bacterium]|nr:C39 family peptidase [Chloroflexota bacterium]